MAAVDPIKQTDPKKSDSTTGETDPDSQQDGFKEFERLDSLLSQVPKKAQYGILKTCDLVLTCIDANTKYIALGTNLGITFLYSRQRKSTQRLKATGQGAVITCVCLHDGVDDFVAVGTASGEVTVFCVPGLVSVQKKQIQKFDVQDVHEHFITCLEWSTNGMKLFSGDKKGQVVVTEIDFYQGMSKSSTLLIEPSTEITQIDYQSRVLLVSTRHRSFVVRLDRHSEVVQVGTKERKMLGQFGACFVPELCKPDNLKLYAARPGRRLWLADSQGSVKSTHIFGDPFSPGVPEISLLAAGKLQLHQDGFQYGKLLWLKRNTLVTWSSSALVLLDPVNNRCLGSQGKLSGLVDVAVVSETEEIFLLRRHADARIIRISNMPEMIQRVEMKSATFTSEGLSENVQAASIKQEQKEESSALSFFKKLGLPLIRQEAQTATMDENKLEDSETDAKELPPVKEIASDELDRLRLFKSNHEVTPPSRDSPPPAAVSLQDSSNPGVKSAPAQSKGDIVFSHRMKKHKKKKPKPDILKGKEPEGDTVSQQSNDSVASLNVNLGFTSEDESTLKALKEADRILNSFHSLINKEDKSESEPLPDVAQLASACLDPVDKLSEESNAPEEQIKTLPMVDIVEATVPRDDNLPFTYAESKLEADLSLKQESKCEIPSYDELQNTAATCDKVSKVPIDYKVPEVSAQSYPKSSLSKPDQENAAHDYTDREYRESQAMCNPSLSEVDQHMETNPGLKYSSHSEQTMAIASHAVDSALARVTGAKQEKDKPEQSIPDGSEEDLPKSDNGSVGNFIKNKKERFPLVYQQSFPDIYMDLNSIEDMDYFGKLEHSESTTEDFYSVYQDMSSTSQEKSKSNQLETEADSSFPSKFAADTHSQDITKTASHVANSWSEITAPANIYSLAVSDHHVWFTDKSENIYYSSLQGAKGIVWRKATGYASQISVSPSGSIVWRLHKGVVHAGTKISTRHPEGLKWVEAVREVQYITVFNNCAWFIKRTGELMVQQGLSRERPCFRSRAVDCGPYRMKQVACGGQGVVWAITEGLQLLVRTGVTCNLPAGEAWEACVREAPPYLFSHVTIDNENVGWAIDVTGRVWFCQGVTLENPKGTSEWFEVPMSGYVIQDASMLDTIRAAAKIFDPSKLSYITSTNRGGLVSAGSQGIWLAMECRNVLQVCRGTVKGYHWMEAQPSGMASSTTWKHICASMNHLEHGLVWAQNMQHDVFAFKTAHGKAHKIVDCDDLACVSVAPRAVWTLSCDGEIRVRTGMGPSYLQGTEWACLDLAQLGEAYFVHLSCNSSYVWAVDAEGGVYQRIGSGPPSPVNLNPVWLPIGTFGELLFTKIFVSPLDWMVWGIDNRRLCFVRVGITGQMPLGKEWIHVPGIQAVDMAITRTGLWAVNTQGEIFFRYGIALDNPTGDYWKKIPGTLAKITASEDDELWGINLDGQIMCCKFKLLPRRQNSTEAFPVRSISRDMSVNEDWEIV